MPNQWTLGLSQIGPTDEQLKALCETAEKGYSVSSCAAAADVSEHTVKHWVRAGHRAMEKLSEGLELTHTELVYAGFVEPFDRARARGVRHLEDVSTERAEKGLGTWSEAITKLERTHRKEWGRQPETAALGGTITLVIEGRPPRPELTEAAQEVLDGGTADRRELPAAPPPGSVPE